MSKHVVIVGAVALGPKVACRIKRLEPDTRVTMMDRDKFISYGGCGIPYYVSGDVADVDALYSTTYHMKRDPTFFKRVKHVDVLTGKEALEIDRREKTLTYRDIDSGEEGVLRYDALVLGTGKRPVIPPIEGSRLPGVHAVTDLHQAMELKGKVTKGAVESAVVVGGGAIGVEMAEALSDMWGIETTIVEMQDQILPTVLGSDMARMTRNILEENGVTVRTSTQLTKILGSESEGVTGVATSGGDIPCQLVLFCIGARPNADLAVKAGLATGPSGGILVDTALRTTDPDIYAGGDCIEVRHLISGDFVHMPLGSLANRQGRVIGSNIAGGFERFDGVVGSFCIKVFEYGVARSGLTEKQARAAGFDPVSSVVVQTDRAHFYQPNSLVYFKLIADRTTRRILGVEGLSENGDGVKGRVDSVASLLPYQATVDKVSNLEVSYSPPFASAMDVVNAAANALENILDGLDAPLPPEDFLERFKSSKQKVLDVRSGSYAEPYIEKYGDRWLGVPQEDLENRWEEVPKDEPLFVFCNSGVRSFEVVRFLTSKGIKCVENVQGGAAMVKGLDKDFI